MPTTTAAGTRREGHRRDTISFSVAENPKPSAVTSSAVSLLPFDCVTVAAASCRSLSDVCLLLELFPRPSPRIAPADPLRDEAAVVAVWLSAIDANQAVSQVTLTTSGWID